VLVLPAVLVVQLSCSLQLRMLYNPKMWTRGTVVTRVGIIRAQLQLWKPLLVLSDHG